MLKPGNLQGLHLSERLGGQTVGKAPAVEALVFSTPGGFYTRHGEVMLLVGEERTCSLLSSEKDCSLQAETG